MAHVWGLYAGVYVVSCHIHGYLGAAIQTARDRADEIRDSHNREHCGRDSDEEV